MRLRAADLFQLFLSAWAAIPGKKGAHVKSHLHGGVLVGYAHRAGASSKATTAEAIGSTFSGDVVHTGGNIISLP